MNPMYRYTTADRMNPVYCIGCREHIPDLVSKAGRGLCPACLTKIAQSQAAQAAPTPVAGPAALPIAPHRQPPPHAVPPAPAYEPMSRDTWIVIGGIVAGVTLLFGILKVVNTVQDNNRRVSYATLLAKLQKENPEKRFAIYGDSVPMNAQLTLLKVVKVDLEREGSAVKAAVTFTSTSAEPVAPEIYMSLYDTTGAMIGRNAVVNHISADLEPSGSDTTKATIQISEAEPVIVAVDDDPAKRQQELEAAQQRSAQTAIVNANKAREDAAVRAEERIRGPKPVPSPWDTVTPEVNAYLKATLKDYDSLKIVNGSPVVTYGPDAWAQRLKYRARNSFGGLVLEEKLFVIMNRQVVDVMDY